MDSDRLMQKMKSSMRSLETRSRFYKEFVKQMGGSEIDGEIRRVKESDPKQAPFQMVVYGIGSIEKDEISRLQLGLAILMKKQNPKWVSEIEVYDPVLSPLDREVIERLGCRCLSHNEQGRRTAERPTLFYMPHCDVDLYNNVLAANWTPENLRRIVILGNPLSLYKRDFEEISECLGRRRHVRDHLRNIMAIVDEENTHEIQVPIRYLQFIQTPSTRSSHHEEEEGAEITKGILRCVYIGGSYFESFHHLAWHFFPFDGSQNDLDNLYTQTGVVLY